MASSVLLLSNPELLCQLSKVGSTHPAILCVRTSDFAGQGPMLSLKRNLVPERPQLFQSPSYRSSTRTLRLARHLFSLLPGN